ncbi:MAG: hypothetical protein PHN42_01285 [Bacilli bacterium]|nr:hypothetical protein [Bacilli bacterium]
MNRVLKLLFVMFLIYLVIQFAFKFIEKGSTVNYQIKSNNNTFSIKEVFTTNVENETNNYYFNITVNDVSFDYEVFENFNMQNRIIKDVKYYGDDTHLCILPIYTGNKILSDVMCKVGGEYYLYHDIKNKNASLDSFVSSLSEIGYSSSSYDNDLGIATTKDSIILYDNVLNNHFLSLENYKGIYTINNRNSQKIYDNSIFENDVYVKSISAFVLNYYVVADYTKEYKFNEFTVIDIITNVKSKISYDYDISMDSYVQGVIDNNVYIFDRNTLKQYELDIKAKTIIEVGNADIGILRYINGNFETINAYEAKNSDITFNQYTTNNIWNNNNYARVDKSGISKSGYYYIYIKTGDKYNVYRSTIQNPVSMTYLYTTDNILDAVYIKDYVYFKEGKNIKRYSDLEGIKTILSNNELEFNKTIKFNVYIK